jgi:hypothetical protein
MSSEYPGFPGTGKEHNYFGGHHHKGVGVEYPDGGYQGKPGHENRGDRGEKGGKLPADDYQRIDAGNLAFFGIFDQKAIPGIGSYLHGAVEERRREEKPEIFRIEGFISRGSAPRYVAFLGNQSTIHLWQINPEKKVKSPGLYSESSFLLL